LNKTECVRAIRAAETEEQAVEIMSDYLKEVTYWAKEEVAIAKDDRAQAVDGYRAFKKMIRDKLQALAEEIP
jgi:hypothetical protein